MFNEWLGRLARSHSALCKLFGYYNSQISQAHRDLCFTFLQSYHIPIPDDMQPRLMYSTKDALRLRDLTQDLLPIPQESLFGDCTMIYLQYAWICGILNQRGYPSLSNEEIAALMTRVQDRADALYQIPLSIQALNSQISK